MIRSTSCLLVLAIESSLAFTSPLSELGDTISRVDCFDEIAFAASGGTLYDAFVRPF